MEGERKEGVYGYTVKSGTEVNDPLSPLFLGTLFLGAPFLSTRLGGVNAACQ